MKNQQYGCHIEVCSPVREMALAELRAHAILVLVAIPGCRGIHAANPIAAEFTLCCGACVALRLTMTIVSGFAHVELGLATNVDLRPLHFGCLRDSFVSELVHRAGCNGITTCVSRYTYLEPDR